MARKRFLIECKCGHEFWRAYPCNPKTLRTYECPKGRPYGPYMRRPKARHVTRLANYVRQLQVATESRRA